MKFSRIINKLESSYQSIGIRSGLLHAYCGTSSSFDAANNCLLFYDWYVQRLNKKEREKQI